MVPICYVGLDHAASSAPSNHPHNAPEFFEDDETGIITLYFTSDRTAGLGLTDIYASTLQPDETFGPACRTSPARCLTSGLRRERARRSPGRRLGSRLEHLARGFRCRPLARYDGGGGRRLCLAAARGARPCPPALSGLSPPSADDGTVLGERTGTGETNSSQRKGWPAPAYA